MTKKPTKTANWKKLPKGKEIETIAENIQEAFARKKLDKKKSSKKSRRKKVIVEASDQPKKRPLTQKELRFIDEYIVDLNGTQAAVRAGYSKRSAHTTCHDVLKKPEIMQRIKQKQMDIQVSTGITVENITKELAKIAFFDLRMALNIDGTVKPIDQLDDNTIAGIAGLEINELFEGTGRDRERVGYTKKIKIADKVAALEKLGKHLGIFTDNLNVVTKEPISIDVTQLTPEQAAEIYKNALKE